MKQGWGASRIENVSKSSTRRQVNAIVSLLLISSKCSTISKKIPNRFS